jgi:hypothetical protein
VGSAACRDAPSGWPGSRAAPAVRRAADPVFNLWRGLNRNERAAEDVGLTALDRRGVRRPFRRCPGRVEILGVAERSMQDPSPTRNDTRSRDQRSVADGIQRAAIRLACGVFLLLAGTFAVIGATLASTYQAAYLAVGLAAIGGSVVVIRVELRRMRQLEQG